MCTHDMYLPAAGYRPAHAEPERHEHRLQRAAVAVEHDPGTNGDDAQADPLRRAGLGLPDDAQLRQEARARRAVLVDHLVLVGAVVVDPGRGHERARARLGRAQPGDQVARPLLAAGAEAALGVVAPALVDRLAGEMQDGVAARQRRCRRAARLRVPGVRLDAAERRLRPLRVAREHGHLVAAGLQLRDHPGADQPRGSRDRHLHPRASS